MSQQIKTIEHLGNCEEQLTSTDCRPRDNQQVTDRLPTVSNTREEKYSTETYVKTNKTYQKRRTKSKKLTKSEEQLIEIPRFG